MNVDVHAGPATDEERAKNRRLLAELKESHLTHVNDTEEMRKGLEQLKAMFSEQFASVKRQFAEQLAQVRAEVTQMRVDFTQLRAECERIGGEVTKSRGEMSDVKRETVKATTEFRNIKDQVTNELRSTQQSSTKLKTDISENQRKVIESQRQVTENQRQVQGLQKELQTKQGVPVPEVLSLKATLQQTYSEFSQLRKQIFDKGLLAPERTEPVKEESPPVGTLGLGEDIFTARLLLRLGFLRAELFASEGSGLEDASQDDRQGKSGTLVRLVSDKLSDSDSDEEVLAREVIHNFQNVAGIPEPVVEPGGHGYCQVVIGWPMVCIATLALQLVVLSLMIRFYLNTHDCFETLPVPFQDLDWWVLHISRAIAMFIAGAFMTKDMMDIANYLMVSSLLEPRMSAEVILSAMIRFILITMLFIANALLFRSYKDPGYLWINMAAVSFVGAFGSDVLGFARTGCFGHHICKAVTAVNFELTFLSEYPSWFPLVSQVTRAVAMAGVVVAAIQVFVDEDYQC